MPETSTGVLDVVVVGGGLAGLTAAVKAAKAGRSVTLIEARRRLGGRARTDAHEGFLRNEGLRALYLAGEGIAVLRSLGIEPAGSKPTVAGLALSGDGTAAELPFGPLALAATEAGVDIRSGRSVRSIEALDRGFDVHIGGETMHAGRVVAAGFGPAALDSLLAGMPTPGGYALGVDRPWYVAFHTPIARLAPEAGAVVHVLNYVPSGELHRTPGEDRAELEGVLDSAQPAWREHLVNARYLHRMVVAHDVPAPGVGVSGRPPTEVPDMSGLADSRRLGRRPPA